MQHNNLDQHAGTRKYTERMSNIGGRRAALKKINTKNKQILGRLEKTTAYYDNRIAARDWKVMSHHLAHMGTYAYKGGGVMNGSVQKILAKAGMSPKPKTAPKGARRRKSKSKGVRLESGPLSKIVRKSISAEDLV
jgi:hypothetical protein